MKSISQIANLSSKNTAKRISLTFFLLIYVGYIVNNSIHHMQAIDLVFRGTRMGLSQMLIMGDEYNIQRLYNSLLIGGQISDTWIIQHGIKTPIVVLSDRKDINFKMLAKPGYTVIISNHDLLLTYSQEIETSDGRIFSVILAQKIQILKHLLYLFGILILFIFVYLYIRRRFFLFAELITQPLIKLREMIDIRIFQENGNDIEKKHDSESISPTLKTKEVEDIYCKFIDLVVKVKEGERIRSRESIQSAILKTTQMLAHDIKRPFGLFDVSLSLIASAKTAEQKLEVIHKLTPEFEKSSRSVNRLIDEMLSVGRHAILQKTKTDIAQIMLSSLQEIFQIQKQSQIELNYDLKHQKKINCDPSVMQRAISNIILNAYEAMDQSQPLTFSTRDYIEANGEAYQELKILNYGNPIPEECLAKIFDPFFSYGKKTGTGLGLPIAKKSVEEHSGNLFCQINKDARTIAFIIQLPCSHISIDQKMKFPEFSYEFLQNKVFKVSDTKENLINARKLKLGMLDDEDMYMKYVINLITQDDELSKAIVLLPFSQPKQLFDYLKKNELDFLICDLFLSENQSGYDVIRTLRENFFQFPIVLHSNQSFYDHAMLEFLDCCFLPKSITRNQLVSFMAKGKSTFHIDQN